MLGEMLHSRNSHSKKRHVEHEYPVQRPKPKSVKYHPDENESSNNEVSHELREFVDSEDSSSRFSIRDLCQHFDGDICDGYNSDYDFSDNEFSLHDMTEKNDDSFFNWCDTASEPELGYFSRQGDWQPPVMLDSTSCDEGVSRPGLAYTVKLTQADIPSYIHIYQSKNTFSSQRTQAASVAHIVETASMSHRQLRNHGQKMRKKIGSIHENFVQVNVPDYILKNIITEQEIKDQVIVFDGGVEGNPPIKRPNNVDNWRQIWISEGMHLHIAKSEDPDKGLVHQAPNGDTYFKLLSRRQAMDILPKTGITELLSTISACEKAKGITLKQGKSKKIFGDDVTRAPMYTSVGVQPNRMKRCVTPVQPFMLKLKSDHWDRITKMMRWSEQSMEMMADHSNLHHLRAARDVVPFKTMQPSPHDKKQSPAKYFGAIAFGRNVFLRCHKDQDYTYSIIQVHLGGRDVYSIDEEVVVYFCLPTQGIAVTLRPSDFLLFNATIPHCISSRCRNNDTVLSVSSYLKTAVVGLNNNGLELLNVQKVLLRRYRMMKEAKVRFPTRQTILRAWCEKYYRSSVIRL